MKTRANVSRINAEIKRLSKIERELLRLQKLNDKLYVAFVNGVDKAFKLGYGQGVLSWAKVSRKRKIG
jgi:hypothetical protein